MDSRVVTNTKNANDPLNDFELQNSSSKSTTIKKLGKNLDSQLVNMSNDIVRREVKIERHRELLNELEQDRIRTLQEQKMRQSQLRKK